MTAYANKSLVDVGVAASELTGHIPFHPTSITVESDRKLSDLLGATVSGWLRLPSETVRLPASDTELNSQSCTTVLSGEGALEHEASSWRVVSPGMCIVVSEVQETAGKPVLRQDIELLGRDQEPKLKYAVYWARVNGGMRRVAWRFCGYGDKT